MGGDEVIWPVAIAAHNKSYNLPEVRITAQYSDVLVNEKLLNIVVN